MLSSTVYSLDALQFSYFAHHRHKSDVKAALKSDTFCLIDITKEHAQQKMPILFKQLVISHKPVETECQVYAV